MCIRDSSYAESDMDSGPGSLASSANLYFVIKIPKTLYVRVGTNTPTTLKSLSESDGNNITAGALSVSYTHLDVYKRQVIDTFNIIANGSISPG